MFEMKPRLGYNFKKVGNINPSLLLSFPVGFITETDGVKRRTEDPHELKPHGGNWLWSVLLGLRMAI